MNKRILLTSSLLFACLVTFAQNPGDIVNYSTKREQIKLTFADTNYTRQEVFSFSYASDSAKYIVHFSATVDTFIIYGDLNLSTFKDQVNNLAKNNWQVNASISDYSAQTMFFKIYSRNVDEDTADIAGTLILRDEIMTFSKQKKDTLHYEKRIHLVDSISSVHSTRQAELTGKTDSLKTATISGIEMIRKYDPVKTDKAKAKYKTDTTYLVKNLINLKSAQNFSQNSFKAIDSFYQQYRIDTLQDIDDTASFTAFNEFTKSVYAYQQTVKLQFKSYQQSQERIDSTQKLLDSLGIYQIDEIYLQFEKGFLERVKASICINGGTPWTFENIYAIGFSSTNNFRNLNTTKLFCRQADGGPLRYIFLSDLFKNTYNNELENYTRDYSPADTTLNHIHPAQTSFLTLYKSKSIHLFDSKIYTDLSGLSDNSPNGLLQTDISRCFNINTVRHQFGYSRADVGYFNYINIYGTLNKIENRQRYLALRNQNIASNDSLTSPSYATNMDFLRYRNATLGITIGAFLFDYPDAKFTVYFDFGAEYSHTPVLNAHKTVDTGVVTIQPDSLHLDANMATLYPKLTFEILSERRVGFKLSYQYNYTFMFSNNQFKQVMSYEKSNLTDFITDKKARQSSMLEFFVRAQASKSNTNEIFFRARFFWQWGDVQTFFPQVQLGYNYNLIFKKQ